MSSGYRLNNMKSYYFKSQYTKKEEEMITDELKNKIKSIEIQTQDKQIIINIPCNAMKREALK